MQALCLRARRGPQPLQPRQPPPAGPKHPPRGFTCTKARKAPCEYFLQEAVLVAALLESQQVSQQVREGTFWAERGGISVKELRRTTGGWGLT